MTWKCLALACLGFALSDPAWCQIPKGGTVILDERGSHADPEFTRDAAPDAAALGGLLTAVALEDWDGFVRDWQRTAHAFGSELGSQRLSNRRQRLLIVAADRLDLSERSVEADPDTVSYLLLATSSGPAAHGRVLPPVDALWPDAWLRLSEATGIAQAELMKKPAMLIRVSYEAYEPPGLKGFRVGELEGSWFLEQGGLRGRMQFVREIPVDPPPPEYEAVKVAIIGQRIFAEVEFDTAAADSSVSVAIGVNGQPVVLGADGVLSCPQIPRRRNAFRCPGIELRAASGASPALAVRPGDKVQVRLADRSIGAVAPSVAGIDIRHQPDLEWTWPVAVIRAGRALQRPVGDIKAASRDEVARVSEETVKAGTLTTTIRLGDVAAMLLLRDRFMRMMREYVKEASAIQSAKELYGFRKMIEPAVLAGSSPLGAVEVIDPTTLAHGKLPYRQVISMDYLKKYFATRGAAEGFLQAKTREALDRYLEAVKASLERAESLKDHQVVELLELTSTSFDAVVEDLLPDLLVPVHDEAGRVQGWEPDRVARAYVRGIGNLGERLRAQRQLGEADRNVLLAAASIPLMGAPAGLLRTVLSFALGAIDALDAATKIVLEERDGRLALGDSAVLGMDRVSMAELQRSPLWANLVAIVGAAVGMRADVLEAVAKVSVSAARTRSAALLSKLDVDEAGAAFVRMSAGEQADTIALLAELTQRAKGPNGLEALSAAERKLLAAGERALKQAAAASGDRDRAFRLWRASINDESRRLLERDGALANAYAGLSPRVRQMLTRCASPCILSRLDADLVNRLSTVIGRHKLAKDDWAAIGTFLFKFEDKLPEAISVLENMPSPAALRARVTHFADFDNLGLATDRFNAIAARYGNDVFDSINKIPRKPKPEGVTTLLSQMGSSRVNDADAARFVLARTVEFIDEAGGNVAVSFERPLREALLLDEMVRGRFATPGGRRYDAQVGALRIEAKNFGSINSLTKDWMPEYPNLPHPKLEFMKDMILNRDNIRNLRWVFPESFAVHKPAIRAFFREVMDDFGRLIETEDVGKLLIDNFGMGPGTIAALRSTFERHFDEIVRFSGRQYR